MSMNGKADLASNNHDKPSYQGGQRGPFLAAASVSLERAGGLRESNESHMPPLQRTARLASASDDLSVVLQSLGWDFRTMVSDQKVARPGAVVRTLNSTLASSSDESVSGRNLPYSLEEIRRMRNILNESSSKARERARNCGNAITKIDRYYHSQSRKRSRGDPSSSDRPATLMSGGPILKIDPQFPAHSDGLEVRLHKVEERPKNFLQSKRSRTSVAEAFMDQRSAGSSKASALADRNMDANKIASGSPGSAEEKVRELVTDTDGWKNPKTKKKRSVIKSDISANAILTRTTVDERQTKQTTQHKHNSSIRPRVVGSHCARPTALNNLSAAGITKLDIASTQNGALMRPLRNDQDSSPLPINKWDRLVDSEKESATPRVVIKNADQEDDFLASPTSIIKGSGSARAPRSNSALLPKSSQNLHRLAEYSNDVEHGSGVSKVNSVGGSINSKRNSTQLPSPPMTHWGEQRPQKISRAARRANLVPLGTSHDGTQTSDVLGNVVNDDILGMPRRISQNSFQQIRKIDNGQAIGLLEYAGSGIANSRLKEKCKRSSEFDHNNCPTQTLSSGCHPKKSKMTNDNDFEDNTWTQARTGRPITPARFGVSSLVEKSENATTTTKQRSIRMVSNRNDIKLGRLPLRKFSDRKDQLDDDHEELLAAANIAMDTRYTGQSSFWKRMEPIFALLSADDINHITGEIRLLDESSASTYFGGHSTRNAKGNLECVSQPSTPAVGIWDEFSTVSNGFAIKKMESNTRIPCQVGYGAEPSLDQLVKEIGAHQGFSICHTLLSAIIDEDEIKDAILNNQHEPLEIPFEEGRWDSRLESFLREAPQTVSINSMSNSHWKIHGELAEEKNEKSASLSELQYRDMSLRDRVLLELSEIGLYPEIVPDLTQSEEEEIIGEICKLESGLQKQAVEKKKLLLKLEKVALAARESQQRQLPQIALDRHVLNTYKKYTAFSRPSALTGKSANRTGRLAPQAFIQRTVDRCRQYEETGKSCFHEPSFKDMFLRVPSYRSTADAAVNTETTVSQDLNKDHRVDSFDKSDRASKDTSRVKNLEEVVGSISGISPALGSCLVTGTKGKRSGRDREGKAQNRDGVPKSGRLCLSNPKVEKKSKTKPKQKISQLSFSCGNGPLPNAVEFPANSRGKDGSYPASGEAAQGRTEEAEIIDLSSLPLPDMDVCNFSENGQDINTWFDIEEDTLQDFDCMGLEIPMDDLSDVKLMI